MNLVVPSIMAPSAIARRCKMEERRKGRWTKLGAIATYTAPSGAEAVFDFSRLSTEVFAFYGKKQWISDSGALPKGTSDEERIAAMKAAFNEAVEKGVKLSEDGRIQIVGKERANASSVKLELRTVKNLNAILVKRMRGETLTQDEESWLEEMLKKY